VLNAELRVDTHLHVWDLAVSDYAWLKPEHGLLYSSWSPEQAERELSRCGFTGAILVQAEDSRADTRYLLEVARTNPWVLGVVGWVQLDDPVVAEQDLETFSQFAKFCGVRHLINDDIRADFLDQKTVRASLVQVAQRGLPYEIHDAWPRHLDQAGRLAAELPELTIVVDHLGLPPRGRSDFAAWRASLARISQLPNTVAKVSGLGCADAGLSPAVLHEVWDTALELFSPDRLMYGGNWPITVSTGGYQPEWQVMSDFLGELSNEDQIRVLSGTAQRVYNLSSNLLSMKRNALC